MTVGANVSSAIAVGDGAIGNGENIAVCVAGGIGVGVVKAIVVGVTNGVGVIDEGVFSTPDMVITAVAEGELVGVVVSVTVVILV